MKILYPNVPYSDIPRLVKEGKIKIGTLIKIKNVIFGIPLQKDLYATIDIDKEKNLYIRYHSMFLGFLKIKGNSIVTISSNKDEVSYNIGKQSNELGDSSKDVVTIHSPIYSPTKPISFSEPLTKEAVGRVISSERNEATIINISIDGLYAQLEWSVGVRSWIGINQLKDNSWHF